LKTSYQKVDKPKIKKKAHIKCFECLALGHFSSECPNKKSDQAKPFRKQRRLSQRMCFSYKEKGNNIVVCLEEEALKQVCQNRTVRFGKPEYPISAKKLELQDNVTKASMCHLTST
jgi:hypothetical protein